MKDEARSNETANMIEIGPTQVQDVDRAEQKQTANEYTTPLNGNSIKLNHRTDTVSGVSLLASRRTKETSKKNNKNNAAAKKRQVVLAGNG